MMSSLARVVLVAASLLAANAEHARAQSQTTPSERPQPAPDDDADEERDPADPMADARRPHAAFFGGATVERQRTNGLQLSASAFGAWDSNLLAEFAGPNATSLLQVGGSYTNLIGDLTYTRRTSRMQLAATGGANTRYYVNLNRFAANDLHSGLGLALRADRLTTISASQTVAYTPVFLFGLFVDALPAELGSIATPNSAYAVNDDRALTSDSKIEVERRFTARSLVNASAAYRHSHFTVVSPRGTDFKTVEGGGFYRYRWTADSDLRLGYTYRRASFIGTELFGQPMQQPIEHNLNLGVAFHPSLTRERRTIVTFEGGTSIVNGPLSTDVTVSRRQLRFVGDAAIAHQTGRTWLTVAAFKRGTGFVQGLGGPIFTDAVSLTTTGFLGPRTDLHASAGYSNGEPSLVGANVNFSTATANLRLRTAVNPRWAFVAEYIYYYYDFSRVLPIAAGLTPRVKRNTLRVGMTLWTPVGR